MDQSPRVSDLRHASAASILIINGGALRKTKLVNCLQKSGYSVLFAEGQPHILKTIDLSRIDLILLSTHHNKGKGASLMRGLRRYLGSNHPPVVVIGPQKFVELSEVLQLGVNEVIETPIKVPAAIARIQAEIERRRFE